MIVIVSVILLLWGTDSSFCSC